MATTLKHSSNKPPPLKRRKLNTTSSRSNLKKSGLYIPIIPLLKDKYSNPCANHNTSMLVNSKLHFYSFQQTQTIKHLLSAHKKQLSIQKWTPQSPSPSPPPIINQIYINNNDIDIQIEIEICNTNNSHLSDNEDNNSELSCFADTDT
eukprot:492663_1